VRAEFVNITKGYRMPLDTSNLPIGRALKVERTAAGLELGKVAAAVGISAGHLSHIERDERTASPELIERIRTAFRELGEAVH
jgi:transcriptional regulator with XRE-family HTH domain